MFTVTGSAVEAINQLTPLRKFRPRAVCDSPSTAHPKLAPLIIDVVARATEGDDDVIETAGAQVFLARETPLQLVGKVLDVRKDIDGRYNFLVTSLL
jgi:iron-sulfur cluster assembly protein